MVAKTLELFVFLQFIHIKWPVRVTVDSMQTASFSPCFDTLTGVSWYLRRLSVCDILRLCFTCAIRSPLGPHVHIGLWARQAAAVLIRAQVSHSQHIRVRLQTLRNTLRGGLRVESKGMCTVTCLPNQIEEIS